MASFASSFVRFAVVLLGYFTVFSLLSLSFFSPSLSPSSFSYVEALDVDVINELEKDENSFVGEERTRLSWKDKLNRHVASKNAKFTNNRFVRKLGGEHLSGLRNGEISYEDPDMQLLQRGAGNGYDFTEKINEQFADTVNTFSSADGNTIIKLFQNVEILKGSDTYQRMIVNEGKTLETLTESELRQLAVGAIRDTRDASNELIAYTQMTEKEKDGFMTTFKNENTELSNRITEGDLEATEEFNKRFTARITNKMNPSVLTSDDKLRKRQEAFLDDSQLRTAIGDEEALEILDSPNLSFRMRV